VQELTAWVAADLGVPWLPALQRIAFAKSPVSAYLTSLLTITVSPDVDDETARKWITAGNEEVGWRVLIARHDAAVVPELVANLPRSFAGLWRVPALSYLRHVMRGPASLIPELRSRFGSPMMPKVLEDVFDALATVHPEGIVRIVHLISQQPDRIPLHHIDLALRHYAQWRERSGMTLMVGDPADPPVLFDRWIARHCALQRWDEDLVPQMLSGLPELAIELVLDTFHADDGKSIKILKALKGLKSYHAGLVEWMLSDPERTQLIPEVFSDCLDKFPARVLERCVTSEHINQDMLLMLLATGENPLPLSVHRRLISRTLQRSNSLHIFSILAHMLKAHSVFDLTELLKSTLSLDDDNAVWFVREVETARGERLIDEAARFRV
jgi:hypothetical protein